MRFFLTLIGISIVILLNGQIKFSNRLGDKDFIRKQAQYASDLAWDLKNRNPDSSFYYAKLALKLAGEISAKKIEAYSLSDIGNYYKRKEEYREALNHYSQSLAVRYHMQDKELIAGGYNQIGLLYQQQEKYDSALFYFELGLSQLKPLESPIQRLKLLNGYSMSLYRTGNYQKALAYVDTAFFLAEHVEDSSSIVKLLQNKGNIHQDLDQNVLALKFYNEAKEYYQNLDDINGIIDMQINLASVYLLEGDFYEAENLLLKAEKNSLEVGLDYNMSTIYFDLAELYLENNKPRSEYYFQQAYKNAKQIGKIPFQIESGIALADIKLQLGHTEKVLELINELEENVEIENSLGLLIDFYQLKSRYYRKLGDFKKALKNNELSLVFKDSLYANLDKVKELSALLEISRQEKKTTFEELKRKEAEKNTTMLQSKVDRIVIFILITLVLVLIIIIWLIRRNHKNKTKANQMEIEKFQQEQSFKNQIDQLIFEADLKFLQDRLVNDEEIRKNIGKDLHDHLASKLAVIQINLDSLTEKEENKSKREDLYSLINLVEESCRDVRAIAHDLIGQDRLRESLSDSFEQHCKRINNSGKLNISFNKIGEAFDIDTEIKKNLLATVILLIDNIIRHAKAVNVSLELFYHDDSIDLALNDDGIGFDYEEKDSKNGVGLINAKERIDQINGELEINTQIKHGTTISISIPIENER